MTLRTVLLWTLAAAPLAAQIPGKIRAEGKAHSRVMEYAAELIDGIGPRLTGSPNLDRAMAWALRTARGMGLVNVHADSWGLFGMGWEERQAWLRMVEPETSPMIVRAAPWSPATPGAVSGEAIAVPGFRSMADAAPHRGKLRGKIVLLGTAPSIPEIFPIQQPLFERLTAIQLQQFAAPPRDGDGKDIAAMATARFDLMERTGRFLADEGALAVLVPSGNDPRGGASGGTIHADTNYTFGWFVYRRERAMRVPLAVMAIEHYGRVTRLLQRGVPVKLELNLDTRTSAEDREASNVVGEIPGAAKDETVMVTAHLDSWSAGTGATDDGAGVVIALEAMRILQAIGAKPDRTIRLALWTGEEQGSLGSRAYAQRHIAEAPTVESDTPQFLRRLSGAVRPKPAHAKLSAVYTLDDGGGRIRGISTGNPALVPLFRRWLAPLGDLGATMVAPRSDCGGDCQTFEQIGIPTPSFKQDPLDYRSRTHHTNFDSYEHLIPADLQQAAVVAATLLWQTAMHPAPLARR